MRTLLLDNEAVAALRDPHHPHHRAAMAAYEANRPARRRDPARRTMVPTAVRVEAGWDRTHPRAAAINRLQIHDVPLDPAAANEAARISAAHRVSVADAHLGAAIAITSGPVTVLTSDPGDLATVAGDRQVTIVTL